MKAESELLLLGLSAVIFAITTGACAALRLMSYSSSDRNGADDESPARFVDRFIDGPVSNYVALVIARIAAAAATILLAPRVAMTLFGDDAVGLLGLVVVTSVAVPLLLGELLSATGPDRFLQATRAATLPLVYLSKPIALAVVRILEKMSPRILTAIVSPILPLKERIELFGYGNGEDDSDTQSLMSSVFDFGDTKVREVMIPRIDMVAVNIHQDMEDALGTIMEAGHSRVPVFDETIDKIVGVVHTKDLLSKIVEGDRFSLEDIRRDVYFVPESKMIDELLSEFKERKIHLAIVVDEYGGTAGLITLEDILEELVGDIQDEFDTEEALVRRLDADAVLCNAKIRLEELNESLGLDLPIGDVDTLGGFIYETFGRVPRVGEFVRRGQLEFKIHSVSRQRIEQVLISGLSAAGVDHSEGAPSKAHGGGNER